jgi:hypothetical protein
VLKTFMPSHQMVFAIKNRTAINIIVLLMILNFEVKNSSSINAKKQNVRAESIILIMLLFVIPKNSSHRGLKK